MRKLLIVDDISLNRQILKRILRDEYEVLEAGDGQSALSILHAEKDGISAVLLDLVMPILDGFQVLSAIRADETISQIPVIVTTGSGLQGSEVNALQLGANDYIVKPYDPEIIKHRLHNTINLRENAAIVNAIRTDALTGLLSRTAFIEKAAKMISEHGAGYYTLACYDINSFKIVNDQYGSDKGDEVLRYIANTFREAFGQKGGICSRITADNFAVLYPRGEFSDEELCKIREASVQPSGSTLLLTYSIGRYIVDDLSISVSAMYDRASIAKASIKGRFDVHVALYDESMRERILRQQEITSEMNIALKNGNFEVWFQPQYNHSTGALIGAESLVRWRHPSRGIISPTEFIPIFERNGFVYELDKYVWEKSCATLRLWFDQNRIPLPLSVNISRYDLFRTDLFDVLVGLTKKYSIPVDLLRLEITESAFSESSEQIINVVKKLISFGFTVEVDDFGSGYSSLNTLKDVPADVLKLDMRFLENTDNSQRGGNILESVVRMARWLGMAVIAEGVETLEQANFLKTIGCNYVQGYLYAKPMTFEEYDALARAAKAEERLLSMQTVETLDNSKFWDPKSMDTLIFNSYVGGACILEKHGKKIEMLRANDKYADVLCGGSGELTLEQALKISWADMLDDNNRKIMSDAINKAISTGNEITVNFASNKIPGSTKTTYLRATLRIIASAGERYLIYCTNSNITSQKEAEQLVEKTAQRMKAVMDNVGSGITASVFDGGEIRFIMTNDRFYKLFGYTREQYDAEVANVLDLVHPEDRKRLKLEVKRIAENGGQSELEYRAINRNGGEIWLDASISETRFSDEKQPVVVTILRDITAEKRAKQMLHDTDEQIRFLGDAAHDLLSGDDIGEGIERALLRTLGYFNGDRAYIIELNYEKQVAINTYELCAEGVQSEKDNLQSISFDASPFWFTASEKNGFIIIENTEELGEERAEERDILLSQGIKSLIAVPLKKEGKLVGFFGVDNPKTQFGRIDRLSAIGDYIVSMLTRRDMTARLESSNEMLISLMNDTPGGFVRMRVLDNGGIIPVYMNEGFCKLVGMTSEEAMTLYKNDAYAGVHPDDLEIVGSAVSQMLLHGETRSSKYRLLHGNGRYIPIMFFGRAVRDKDGETYFNIYYTDFSEQDKLEQQRTSLLDNLPCGAGIYEVTEDDRINVVYLNRRYRELVGREVDMSGGPVSAVPSIMPEDRPRFLEALRYAIAGNQKSECDIHILHGDGDYRLLHISGHILRQSDGTITVYATYVPISEDALSYREMLPVALAAVMDNSRDLSFIKDKNLRYISASRAYARKLGYDDAKSIIGKSDLDLIDNRFAEKYHGIDSEILEYGQAKLDCDEVLPLPEGGERYVRISKYPLLDNDGCVIGIYGVGVDTTEFHNNYEKLKFLTDTLPGGIASFAIIDGSTKLTYFNDGFYEYTGYSREEFQTRFDANPFFFVHSDDTSVAYEMINDLRENDYVPDKTFRCYTKSGECRWFTMKGRVINRSGSSYTVNTVQFDITEQKFAEEQLRISKEQFRIAAALGDRTVARYDIKTKIYYNDSEMLTKLGFGSEIPDVPDTFVKSGIVDEGSVEELYGLYNSIRGGSQNASAVVLMRVADKGFRWFRLNATTTFDYDGSPSEAILVFYDVTEQREKEAVYAKWQQSLNNKNPETYTVFRCNLSKNTSLDAVDGSLLAINFSPEASTFDSRTKEYAEEYVFSDDRDSYIEMMDSDTLLADYYRFRRTKAMDYREITENGGYRWLRLTVELTEYPDSTDVLAFLMYENIDKTKREELVTRELAETDPLTGLLNRITFSDRMDRVIHEDEGKSIFAMFMLDIDGFKLINDSFGHTVGDKALIDVAGILKSVVRRDDILGRLGGDEFLICICKAPNLAAVGRKARQICDAVKKSFSVEVNVSASIGIALCPNDGTDFSTLYHKADMALYHVKATGKDNYAFFNERMISEKPCRDEAVRGIVPMPSAHESLKRRMLIVEDNKLSRDVLVNIFRDEFIIDTADDGNAALMKMRRYGNAISVVLLDLVMPGVDGFEVLEKIRANTDMQAVPVIVVSGTDERETALKSIRYGACDFVTKPVNADLIKLRVRSAVSRAENDRLRAQNSLLIMQNSEIEKFKTVIENENTVVVEYDVKGNKFEYDAAASLYIDAEFDRRPLWMILTQDCAAEADEVNKVAELTADLLCDDGRMTDATRLAIRTPSGKRHIFAVGLIKKPDANRVGNDIVITLNDTEI